MSVNKLQETVRTSLGSQMVKNLPAMQETQVQSLGQEDPLEKGMATHSSIRAWRIPWTKEPGGLQTGLDGLDGIIDSMDMNLSKLQEIVKESRVWRAIVHRVIKSWADRKTNTSDVGAIVPVYS